MTELERCLDFITGIADRAAMVKEPSRYGLAHLNPDLPSVWSRNYLFANENLDGATAASLAAETDRILGGIGLRHRKVELIDAEAGDRLEPGFRQLGWDSECDVIMVARRDLDRPVDTSLVCGVGLGEVAAAGADGWRAEPRIENQDVVRQLVDNRRVMAEAVDTRFFAARVAGQIGSYWELSFDDRSEE